MCRRSGIQRQDQITQGRRWLCELSCPSPSGRCFLLPSRPIVVTAVLRLQPFGKSRLEGLEEARPLTAAAGRGARGMVPTGSGFLASCKSVPTTQAHVPSTLLSWVSQLKTAFWHGRGLGPRNVLAQGCRRLVSRDGKTGPQQMMVGRFELAGLSKRCTQLAGSRWPLEEELFAVKSRGSPKVADAAETADTANSEPVAASAVPRPVDVELTKRDMMCDTGAVQASQKRMLGAGAKETRGPCRLCGLDRLTGSASILMQEAERLGLMCSFADDCSEWC